MMSYNICLHPERFTELQDLIFSITNLLPKLGCWSTDYVTASCNILASSMAEYVIFYHLILYLFWWPGLVIY